ncbi:MAG TPA: hypothetical protein VL551_22380 [Actinospica sp.]|jgi:hypothetical protein|nr:hypothetical protein [Actinospica sp.]
MADSELSGNGASEPGRIPGQRSRHCGAPESDFVWAQAPAATVTPWTEEIDYVPLDESFVRAAHVHEACARTRALEATWRRHEAEAQARITPRTPAPGVAWTVRPARHLRSLRPSSVWLLGGLLALAAVLPITLGVLH